MPRKRKVSPKGDSKTFDWLERRLQEKREAWWPFQTEAEYKQFAELQKEQSRLGQTFFADYRADDEAAGTSPERLLAWCELLYTQIASTAPSVEEQEDERRYLIDCLWQKLRELGQTDHEPPQPPNDYWRTDGAARLAIDAARRWIKDEFF